MGKPTLGELMYFNKHGVFPDSYLNRIDASLEEGVETTDQKVRQKAAKELAPTTEPTPPQYPKGLGGGWFELSNGDKVRTKPKAVKAQNILDGKT